MVADFRQVGTADCSSKRLKMVVNTSASWSAQVQMVTSFGPAAFLALTLYRVNLTSCWFSLIALSFPGRAGYVSAAIRRSKRENKWLREWQWQCVVCGVKVLLYALLEAAFGLTDASSRALPCLFVGLKVPRLERRITRPEQGLPLAFETRFLVGEHFNCFCLQNSLRTEVYVWKDTWCVSGAERDPAVNGLEVIRWYQDFMTNPASRARQIAASKLFFQAHDLAHASATAKLPAQAHASAQLPAQASVTILDKPSVSPFCGTHLAYKVPPPRKRRSRPRPGSLKSPLSTTQPALAGFAPLMVWQTLRSTSASGPQSAAWLTPASGPQSAAWLTPASGPQLAAWSISASGPQSAARSTPASGPQSAAR